MIVPETNLPGRKPSSRLLRGLLASLFFGAALWCFWVYSQIRNVADHDEARHAGAIAVFGAAEYYGRPSPVLHARLDHALDLYTHKMAPLIITLGGGEGIDAANRNNLSSEGAVGRAYLLANGVPDHDIIAETQSKDTEESVARLAMIARENNLKSIIVVSDGTHLFRVRELCRAQGLTVYTSPRPELGHISALDRLNRIVHEMGGYTLWRLGLD
ncbi:MAG: YdcF family protein [Acidobacteriaceae bacterium]